MNTLMLLQKLKSELMQESINLFRNFENAKEEKSQKYLLDLHAKKEEQIQNLETSIQQIKAGTNQTLYSYQTVNYVKQSAPVPHQWQKKMKQLKQRTKLYENILDYHSIGTKEIEYFAKLPNHTKENNITQKEMIRQASINKAKRLMPNLY